MVRWLVTLVATALILGASSPAAAQSVPRKVLILNSFEREFEPYGTFVDQIRSELKRSSPVPVTFFEMSLQLALTPGSEQELRSLQYLQSIFADQGLDLIVTLGGNAAQFAQRYRERLFPATPILQAAVNSRRVTAASPNTTTVAVDEDFPQMIQNILDVVPDTTTVFVVIGTSAFEQYWFTQLPREFARFTPRVTLEWSNHMSFDEILARVASLPPRSAILYLTLVADTNGVVQTDTSVLGQLHAAANAPLFGLYDVQIGDGVVGGALTRVNDSSRIAANAALRVLNGEQVDAMHVSAVDKSRPTYDWRELQRWGISEARLPPESIIRFRPPGAWDEYRVYIIGAGTLVALQSVLIAGLFVQRARRRRAEGALRHSYEQNQDLAGRLINAQEEERTRIARDLHDDMSQQLAGLGIMLSGLKRQIGKFGSQPDLDDTVATLQNRTSALAEGIRTLSHELHPSALQHTGLVAALRRHCAEVEDNHGLTVTFTADADLGVPDPEASLCLYRVAQEALVNVVRHARATTVLVRLQVAPDGVELAVIDDGVGFVTGQRAGRGLGLRSIDERVRLTRGRVTIDSRPGHGTRVSVHIPVSAGHQAPVVEIPAPSRVM